MDLLVSLFEKTTGQKSSSIALLPQSGSNRKYYRIIGDKGLSLIGVYSTNRTENNTFLSFSRAMRESGLKVPQICAEDLDNNIYLQEDLGDTSLYQHILDIREKDGAFTSELEELYKRVLDDLKVFQQKAAKVVDFSLCYPRAAFDERSMNWDLQYFKYYFLKLAKIPFNEELLEKDFDVLKDYLLRQPLDVFLYRDFQSRNIMLRGDSLEPWYIDYQGGRRGAKHYDVASLLFDAKADIPADTRTRLAEYFFADEAKEQLPVFHAFVLIRIMQAMGAYGYRGFFERKEHFLQSIPYALCNIKYLLSNNLLPNIDIPHLRGVLEALESSPVIQSIINPAKPKLHVYVSSFSYKRVIPNTYNGGGHTFDCRALPNPGRYAEYKQSTGKDADVIAFFDNYQDEMQKFLNAAKTIVSMSVENYMERGFDSLMVSFGCTGGQHRSVYCAENMGRWLKDTYDIDVTVRHIEQELKK
ncbi:MAG: phosphotransferase [Bacteroidales bacterium]|nr:phosphotransferase [Bacteroidales bacterium]